MVKRLFITVTMLAALVQAGISQESSSLLEINEMWGRFCMAFDSLDHRPLEEIHSKELVRVPGGQAVLDYQRCINSYKASFRMSAGNGSTSNLTLRFFERVWNDSVASERGIYRMVVNRGRSDEGVFYGKFHALLKKEDGSWKIVMDYDSDENGTIGEDDFARAHAMEDIAGFVKR